ncbi:uncharacterized protein B0H64DRAFT_148401 [Chaetomium fimeti]|uniref:Uncharacterized protein n=1 Tax=Chaetomium fimeti TaxID=1854472 RepID=A0AAE0LSU0_9PEZI|nr:hypothetical protein B0H64DRAFT_148401 [Chaetomium fimeti]
MRLQGAWKRHALPLTLWMATAGATITSPPERRQEPSITAISDCGFKAHETVQFCKAGTATYTVIAPGIPTSDLASSYTECHPHVSETWCMNPNGGEVQVAEATPPPSIESVTDCHMRDTEVYCSSDATEYRVLVTVTATADLPPMYTGCHPHDSVTYCLTPSGDDAQLQSESEEAEAGADEPTEENCHFHAGVEHCVGGSGGARSCERTDREYNIPLRIGLLFAILVTSAIGVFTPILLAKFLSTRANTALLIIKQFGTGVIMSTALVHLFTHAELMFGNECLGELKYEATTAAILMAGLFISFLIEYLGFRFVKSQAKKSAAVQTMEGVAVPMQSLRSLEMVSVYVMEAGVIFHSMSESFPQILPPVEAPYANQPQVIGLTLVVAGDSFLLTLFVVIIFHQMFEGLALGTRIAALGSGGNSSFTVGHSHGHGHGHGAPITDAKQTGEGSASSTGQGDPVPSYGDATGSAQPLFHVSMAKKIYLATAFALVTPVGMAIGIGVLNVFNGNDPQTIVAIGVLDAFSAGILLWVGVVEMWAADWVYGGGLTDASALVTCLGMGGLVSGMVIMSVLGKWA